MKNVTNFSSRTDVLNYGTFQVKAIFSTCPFLSIKNLFEQKGPFSVQKKRKNNHEQYLMLFLYNGQAQIFLTA